MNRGFFPEDKDKPASIADVKAGLAKIIVYGLPEELQKQLEADLESAKKADYARIRAWEDKFGRPFPKTIEELQRLAAECGITGQTVFEGEYGWNEVLPIIEGYLDRYSSTHHHEIAPRYMTIGECLLKLPLDGNDRHKRHLFDKILKRCKWVRREGGKRGKPGKINEDDFLILRQMMKEKSSSKTDYSDAIDMLKSDPTPAEIAAAKAAIRGKK